MTKPERQTLLLNPIVSTLKKQNRTNFFVRGSATEVSHISPLARRRLAEDPVNEIHKRQVGTGHCGGFRLISQK